jgi:hypothetical protein
LSVLTKVFIVLHVVISLMLAAGLIVFVNRAENYNVAMKADKAKLASQASQLANAMIDARAQADNAQAARVARDAAIADGQKALAAAETEIADAKVGVAEAQSSAKTLQVSIDNLTAAVNASEAQRKALSDLLDTTRTDNNTLNVKNGQMNLAISDLTNKLEVVTRRATDYQETIAELKSAKEAAEKQVVDLGGHIGAPSGLAAGAPSINGVVRSSRLINGIPYATISIGADAQVVKGMKFNVVDSAKGAFLGELTIEQVDERESTGKLEGPHIADIQPGLEVKTQL